MKTLLRLALALLMLTTLHGSALAEPMVHVADNADVLTDAEEAHLNEAMRALYEEFEFDSVIVTTNDYQGKSSQLFTNDFYDSFRDYASYPDGVILSLNPSVPPRGEVYESARGSGMKMLSDRGEDDLFNVLRPYAADQDYSGMFKAYVSYLRDTLTPATPFELAGAYAPFVLIAGFVIALVSVLVMKGKLKTARPQSAASRYVIPNSLNLAQARDIFLYETVVRRKIETPKSGGSSGGGTRSTSSSGNTYGGRGGKL